MRSYVYVVLCSLLGIQLSASAQFRTKLLRTDTAFFDLGNLTYEHDMQIIKYWKIKNLSDDTVIAPTVIDVWNDCMIDPMHSSAGPLAPHSKRKVEIRIYIPRYDLGGRYCKTGYAEAFIAKDSAGSKIRVATEKYDMQVRCNMLPKNVLKKD